MEVVSSTFQPMIFIHTYSKHALIFWPSIFHHGFMFNKKNIRQSSYVSGFLHEHRILAISQVTHLSLSN